MKGSVAKEKSNKGSGILEKLGIFGMSEIEDMILAGLVTGDPVLLVGTHGTAKTLLCSRLAKAMGLRFWAYDASKALFEDVIGFPNPYEIKEGRINYVSTPMSIWDKEFVLIDEISRANYQLQAKWLELIRARTVMGQKAKSIRYIFSAMNPPDYPGARPLDPALAGRFGFIIEVPTFSSMDNESQRRILKTLTEDDAIHLSRPKGQEQFDINHIVTSARDGFSEVEKVVGNRIEDYIFFLKDALNESGFHLDGRRASMIKRGLIAVLSMKKSKGEKFNKSLASVFRMATPYLLPYSVEREKFNADSLDEIIDDAVYQFSGEKIYVSGPIQNELKLTRMLQKLDEDEEIGKKVEILLNLYKVTDGATDEIIHRVYNVYAELFSQRGIDCEEFLRNIIARNRKVNSVMIPLNRIESLAYWFYFALCGKDRKRREIYESTLSDIREKLTRILGGGKKC